MNIIIIVLGIVIVLLLYVLYFYNSGTSNNLISQANLNATNPPITSINSPTNTRYSYGVWLYVNSWNNTKQKIIFSRNNNISLELDSMTPTLKCNIMMSDLKTVKTTIVTDNFPLQKWVYIIISIDNQFMDCYLDGKLIKSSKIITINDTPTNMSNENQYLIPANPPNDTIPIIIGGNATTQTPFDAVISGFVRWTTPCDPQTAWSSYMAGNSQVNKSNSLSFSSFNANLNIIKDNLQYSNIKLF